MSAGKERHVAVKQPRRHAATGLYVKAANGLRVRHRKVRRLVAKMRAEMPWLEPSDLPACRAWAELEILCAYAFSELAGAGLMNAEGEPRRLLTDYRQLRQVQLSYKRRTRHDPSGPYGNESQRHEGCARFGRSYGESPKRAEVSVRNEVDDEHRSK